MQISDLHSKTFGESHADLLAAVKAQTPDLIFLTGDLIQEGNPPADLEPLFAGLTQLAPTYFVTGNHEWVLLNDAREELFSILNRSGVRRLENEYEVLEKDGERIVIAGVDDPNGPREHKSARSLVSEIRKAVGEDACILMLSHRNTELSSWANLRVSAVFCGHVHGGIVRLPLLGGVFGTEHDLFPKYDKGVFVMDDTTMLVSPGLGEHRWLPVRIFNPPELSVAVLTRTEKR